MFEDKRIVVTDLNQSQLEGNKKDDYIETKLKMTKVRTCSLCSIKFTLLDTLGVMCCGTRGARRDHIDFESECIWDHSKVLIPYTHYLCMLSDGCIPDHLQPTRDSTNQITGVVGAHNHVTRSGGAQEPEDIVIFRTR